MRLQQYVVRRVALLVPSLVGVSVLSFVLVRVLPGDPVRSVLSQSATPAEVRAARVRFGLDHSVLDQYWLYLGQLLHGQLGVSFQTGQPISSEIGARVGATAELVAYAFVIAALVALFLGIRGARHPGRPSDLIGRFLGVLGSAVPEFVLGLILLVVFYGDLGWAPAPNGRVSASVGLHSISGISTLDAVITGNGAALGSALAHLVLPVLTLALVVVSPLIRSVRFAASGALESEVYVCALAHGLPTRRTVRSYVARVVVTGLPTLGALVIGNLIGGAVIVESIYAWAGFGQWGTNGLLTRDYPVIQAFVLITALAYVMVFLLADVAHAVLDPRVRL
ncbi:MAG: transporter permease [Acidimicrobiaceae bacterium]|nr:transporter permease [Acidimicrobiaceae bacterium]